MEILTMRIKKYEAGISEAEKSLTIVQMMMTSRAI